MKEFLRKRMPPSIFGALLFDLEDRLRAGTMQAYLVVKENFATLTAKKARLVEGTTRYNIMEQAFEDTCSSHGGLVLTNGIVPHTDLKIFQPFHRFECDGQGFVLGLATMPEANALPTKNMSRGSGVALNYSLQPSLFPKDGLQAGDIFILLLVAKDRQSAGQIAELAIGVIDSAYTQYFFYEPLSTYLQGYADEPDPSPVQESLAAPTIRLRTNVKPFVPPEMPAEGKKATEENDE
jgi:hypothetical protein